ncbi:MAG: DUF192 domain-containing protein [Acidimicrobiales bacterium]
MTPQARVLLWAVATAAVVVVGFGVFVVVRANRPADPGPGAGRKNRTPVAGFGQIAFGVDTGGSTPRCALLAETEAQQELGLMNRRDLAGYDGMLFRFSADTTVAFYMKDTPLPLSIAWFDSGGGYVSSTDMEPCLDAPQCPTYAAARPYRFALEVPKGGLAGFGIGAGSHLVVGGSCA